MKLKLNRAPGFEPGFPVRGITVVLPLNYAPICRNQTGMPLCIKPLRGICVCSICAALYENHVNIRGVYVFTSSSLHYIISVRDMWDNRDIFK